MSTVTIVPAVFTASATSAAIDLGEGTLVGLEFPATLAGGSTTLKFQSSSDANGTYQDIYYLNGVAATILTLTSIAAAHNISISPLTLAGFRFLKLVLSASESVTINCMVRTV